MKNNRKSPPVTSGKAIASLVLGISSFIGACVTGILGVVFGFLALSDINKSRGRVRGKGMAITGIILGFFGIFWTFAIFLAMLLPAVHQVRQAALRNVSMNNMRELTIGMHNYHESYKRLPAQDNNGLSWRVHLLPFLNEMALYEKFNLDESWDSPNNIALLDQMPFVYANPNHELAPGMTVYQVPFTDVESNPDHSTYALFDNSGEGISFASVRDGLANTVMLVDVQPELAVEWTRPSDWEFDPANPTKGLGTERMSVFILGFADGAVRFANLKRSETTFGAAVTRSGGEQLQFESLE